MKMKSPITSLHKAIAKQTPIEQIRAMITHGADPLAATPKGYTATHAAAYAGNVEMLNELKQRNQLVHTPSLFDGPPLMIALFRRQSAAALWLIKHGAPLDWLFGPIRFDGESLEGLSPIHFAAIRDDLSLLKALHAQGVYLNSAPHLGLTPLHIAAKYGHVRIVNWLIEQGAYIDAQDEVLGYTPLHYACANGHGEVAEQLLARGADLTRIDKEELLPLFLAAQSGMFALVQKIARRYPAFLGVKNRFKGSLLHVVLRSTQFNQELFLWLLRQDQIDQFAVDEMRRTALHYGLRTSAMVEALISRGCKVNARDNNNDTPLHFAAAQPSYRRAVTTLLSRGAMINARNNDNRTPLFLAIEARNTETALLLLEHGADPTIRGDWFPHPLTPLELAAQMGDIRVMNRIDPESEALLNPADYFGMTPLHLAALEGNLERLESFLKGRHPDDARDKCGFTPLHCAVVAGRVEAVQRLLKAGADPNTLDKAEITPLISAARQNHAKLIDLLVAHGVDVNYANRFGVTALHVAALCYHAEALERLLHHGANPNAALGGALTGTTPVALIFPEKHDLRRRLLRHGATAAPAQSFQADRLCPVCGIELLADGDMEVLHGGLFSPAHDTELNVTFNCRLCVSTFESDGYGSGVIGNAEDTYIFLETHNSWASNVEF